jgi:catechol 2,3-dioxygenase-like lactoylglutathione lyase family enzyme
MNVNRQLPDPHVTPVRPRKLAHVVLRVSDLKRSREWYLKVLEARPAFENDMVCFLTYDDEHHRIGLIARPDLATSSDANTGLEHIAFTYGSLGELLANYRRLTAQAITPYWSINHGPTISLYYKDPDGNRLELQHDVFERPEDLDAFFAGGAYEENFIGVRFDPEQLIARYEAGEPLAAIVARPRLDAGSTPWDMFIA